MSNIPQPLAYLFKLIQEVQFGKIEDLKVENGIPQLDQEFLVEYEIGKAKGPITLVDAEAYAEKPEIKEFMEILKKHDRTTVKAIVIKNGLPDEVSMIVPSFVVAEDFSQE